MKTFKNTKYGITFLGSLLFIVLFSACRSDNDIEVDISNYSELFEIEFEGQIGDVVRNPATSTISFEYAGNFDAITISNMEITQDATSNFSQGSAVNFSTAGNTVDLTVTSPSGDSSKTYTLMAVRNATIPNTESKCELLGIEFVNQAAGPAVINYAQQTVNFNYSLDFATIMIADLQIPEGATTNYDTESIIDFSTDDTAQLTITGSDGCTQTFTMTATYYLPFIGDFVMNNDLSTWWNGFSGPWFTSYRSSILHDGDGSHVGGNSPSPAYNSYDFNSSGVTYATWDFYSYFTQWASAGAPIFNNGGQFYDNTLSMELTGSTPEGLLEGTFVYGAGSDGEYGSFIHTNTETTEDVDLNANFAVLPEAGTWQADLSSGELTFTGANGAITTSGLNWTFTQENVDGDGELEDVLKIWLPVNVTGLDPSIATTDIILENLNKATLVQYVFVRQ